MATLATTSSLREAITPEALTRARRRLLTAEPNPTRANTPTPGRPTDDQLRVLAASDWAPPRMTALDANTFATADTVTRALLAESARETLVRRLTAERPHGTYDDTRAGHDAFSRGVADDYDHGNHHLARATIHPARPGLVPRACLSALALRGTDAPIIDELAQASDTNPIVSILADAALIDLDRYATGRGLRYSRVGIDPWITRPCDDPTGQADRILYVGRDGARIHVKAGRIIVDATAHMHAWRRSLAGARTRRSQGHRRRVFQRLLRRSRRVCGRRCHVRRAQPAPTPRPAQRRPVLRVRHPPVRMRRRAARRRARTIPRQRACATDKRPGLALNLME